MSVYNRDSAAAESNLECVDLAVFNCMEMKDGCADSTVRSLCPRTCQCDTMELYLRTGCSACDHVVLETVSQVRN